MGFFHLPEVEPGIAKAEICEVILRRCFYVLLSPDIISDRIVNQEGIAQIVNVAFYGCFTDGLVLYALECRRKLTGICQ